MAAAATPVADGVESAAEHSSDIRTAVAVPADLGRTKRGCRPRDLDAEDPDWVSRQRRLKRKPRWRDVGAEMADAADDGEEEEGGEEEV